MIKPINTGGGATPGGADFLALPYEARNIIYDKME